MSHLKTVLTDADQNISLDSYEVSADNGPTLAGHPDWKLTKKTLQGGTSEGVELVELDNGEISISVLPTRGMGIFDVRFKEIGFGWESPVKRPTHPAFVNLQARDGLGWLGGFNEFLCRCGLAWHGAPGVDEKTGEFLTLHGRIANIPAHYVETEISTEENGKLSVTGVVDETMMFGTTLRLESRLETVAGSTEFVVKDKVTNFGGSPQEIELLYHTNFGTPLLEESAQVLIAAEEIAPRDDWAAEEISSWQTYTAPEPGRVEQCYFLKPATGNDGLSTALLRNGAGNLGMSMEFNAKQLPIFTIWKNTQAEADGYCTGLEPGTSLPNVRSFERDHGRVITLQPGESYEIDLKFTVLSDSTQVAEVEQQIKSLQEHFQPTIHSKPIAKYSPE